MIPLHYSVLVYIIPALYAHTSNQHHIALSLFTLLPFATLNHALQPSTPFIIMLADRLGAHALAAVIATEHAQLQYEKQNILFWLALLYTVVSFHKLKRLLNNSRLVHNTMHLVSATGILVHVYSMKR